MVHRVVREPFLRGKYLLSRSADQKKFETFREQGFDYAEIWHTYRLDLRRLWKTWYMCRLRVRKIWKLANAGPSTNEDYASSVAKRKCVLLQEYRQALLPRFGQRGLDTTWQMMQTYANVTISKLKLVWFLCVLLSLYVLSVVDLCFPTVSLFLLLMVVRSINNIDVMITIVSATTTTNTSIKNVFDTNKNISINISTLYLLGSFLFLFSYYC